MRTTKIQIPPAMREYNEQVEHADFMLDYQFDQESAETLLMRLKQARCYPASASALEKAMAGIAVKQSADPMIKELKALGLIQGK